MAEPEMALDVPQALVRVLPLRRDSALGRPRSCGARWAMRSVTPSGGRRSSAPRRRCGRRRHVAGHRIGTISTSPPSTRTSDPTLPSPAGTRSASARAAGGAGARLLGGEPAGEPRADLPTDLLWRTSAQPGSDGKGGPLIDWMRLIWPQDRRSWFAVSAAVLLVNLDWEEARWHDRRRLEALFEPWTPLGREAALLVAVAFQAKEPGERGLAVDAAIAAVSAGRLPSDLVVRAFDAVATALEPQPPTKYPLTLFRPGRLATSLETVARRSDVHRAWALEVAAGALARIVATQQPAPVAVGQITPLLRLMVELAAGRPSAPRRPPRERCRACPRDPARLRGSRPGCSASPASSRPEVRQSISAMRRPTRASAPATSS